MAHRPARHRYSYQEYLAYERDSGMKHEYDGGDIVAMAGGSRRHNALASRVSGALESSRAPGCIAFQSDQRVRILATGKATYPDVSMVCGPIEGDPADPTGATITNPTLIIEVLSPSTEQDDRGDKWQHYQLMPSLQEYVLVSQSHPRVERYRRLAAGNTTTRRRARARCSCRPGRCSISLASIPSCRIEASGVTVEPLPWLRSDSDWKGLSSRFSGWISVAA
jgi:Uma2 family endonuclease